MRKFIGRVVVLIPVVAGILASCSPDNSAENQKSGIEVKPLQATNTSATIDIPRPSPESMDPDVAAVLDESWTKLATKLADNGLPSSERAQAYAQYGLDAFGNGLAIPAEMAFENATRLAPDEVRWVYFLALMQEYSGTLDKAVGNFERVLELRPGDLPSLLRLGDVHFEQSLMQEAQQRFQLALAQDPGSASAHYGLGRIASVQGKYQQAITHFEKTLELQPNANRTNYFLGMTWRNLGDKKKAQEFLANHGPNEPSFADPLFDEISGGKTRIAGLWVHMNAGSQAFVEGNYPLAVKEFRLATQDLPDDPRAWQSLGMALNKARDGEAAKLAYYKALELSKDNAVIHHELAKLLIQANEYSNAEKHLMQAIAKDANMLEAHTTLARLLTNTGRMAEALKRYELAIDLDPQSGELAVARAETLLALKRPEEAEKALSDMIRINPNDVNVRMAYGLVLGDTGQLEKAMVEIQQALSAAEDDDTRGRAHYAVGQIQIRKGDANSAITSFGHALKLNPRHQAAGLELARSFIRVRDYSQALATYEAHIGYWPDIDTTRVEAARVAVMLGNGTKARRLLEDGIENSAATARLFGSLARLLVLSTEVRVRDHKLALDYAQRALALNGASQHRETIALCQAASGNFAKAVKLQELLVNDAGAAATARVRTRMQKNLDRYRAKTLGRLPFDAS